MPNYESDLSVITKTKDLCSYIMTVTNKSPKKFRFTLVAKLQNYALNAIENMYRANECYVKSGDVQMIKSRAEFQQNALTELKLIGYIAQLSMEQECILPKQYEQISEKVYNCQNLLAGWIKSDKKRLQNK